MTGPATHLDILVEAFGRLGVVVRWESLGGSGGGLCTLGAAKVLFLDSDSDEETLIEKCIQGLATLPQAESMYLLPELRERLDQHMKHRD